MSQFIRSDYRVSPPRGKNVNNAQVIYQRLAQKFDTLTPSCHFNIGTADTNSMQDDRKIT